MTTITKPCSVDKLKKFLDGRDKIPDGECHIFLFFDYHFELQSGDVPTGSKGFFSIQAVDSDVYWIGEFQLTSKIKKLRVFTVKYNKTTELLLPELWEGFLRFLKIKSLNYDFDCLAFVCLLMGQANRLKDGSSVEDCWAGIHQRHASSGDIVVVRTTDNDINHWAICVGDDLYLSKFGKGGGSVLFTDWSNMRKFYKGMCEPCVVVPYKDRKTKRQRVMEKFNQKDQL